MKLYELFSAILDYPDLKLSERVDETIALLSSFHGKAATLLREFQTFLAKTPMGTVEEIYSKTFDLQAVCYPYVGYHLFGEDHRRALFMAGLKGDYKANQFSCGNELPDHLGVMLRFLGKENQDGRDEMIDLCIIPALKKMVAGLAGTSNPYRNVLESLLLAFWQLRNSSLGEFHDAEPRATDSATPEAENGWPTPDFANHIEVKP